jgi:hypothetical protein
MGILLADQKIHSLQAALKDGLIPGQVFTESAAFGKAIPESHLDKINKYTRREYTPDELYTFPVLAIDEQVTRNFVIYTAESQKASAKAWEGIPFLFNSQGTGQNAFAGADHDLKAASQFGRIYASSLVRTPENTIGTLVWVYTVRGASKEIDDFINKVDGGIHREVSIHVQPSAIECNVCGEQWPCPDQHYPGETYDGKTATISTKGEFTPLELSAVACPGSTIAHVMATDSVGDYTVMPLKEALGGSFNKRGTKVNKSEQDAQAEAEKAEAEKVAAEKAAAEAAAIAEKMCAECGAEADHNMDTCTCSCHGEAKKAKPGHDDDDNDNPPNDDGPGGDAGGETKVIPAAYSAEAFTLFEGKCPACGRDGKVAEAVVMDEGKFKETLADLRAKATKAIEEVTSEAKTKIEAAEANATLGVKIMTDLREECVDLAIARGLKTADEREAYAAEVQSLDYQGIRVLRDTIVQAKPKVSEDEAKAAIVKSMKERWQEENGVQVQTDSNGKKSTKQGRQPRLATKIGPASDKE